MTTVLTSIILAIAATGILTGCGDDGGAESAAKVEDQPAGQSSAQPPGQARAVQELEQCVRRWNSGAIDPEVSGFLSVMGEDALVRVSLKEEGERTGDPPDLVNAGSCIIAAEEADGSFVMLAENRDNNLDGDADDPGEAEFGDLAEYPKKYLPSESGANARIGPGESLELLISSGGTADCGARWLGGRAFYVTEMTVSGLSCGAGYGVVESFMTTAREPAGWRYHERENGYLMTSTNRVERRIAFNGHYGSE
jgi:hypothetical protein